MTRKDRFHASDLGPFRRRRGPLPVRLWARVDKSAGLDGCWLWTGSVSNLGYGRIRGVDGRSIGVLARTSTSGPMAVGP